ncbi:hypothetical protein D9613_009892 [Agrocybe pediades]|uniref:Uncharacterized protein n=1 Tax=Agrocybe pediades TaxID=84607 RepID=A0A8H4QWD3_9AGAR|nr:hypothetical protein D9613_009892 [Agrocybe pediades]
MADARQEERVRRKIQLEEHLREVGKLLAKVDAQLLVEHDHDMFALGERVRKHEKEARALLAKLNKAETFIDKIVNPTQYAKAVKRFEGTLNMHDRNYDYLTKQRKDHEKTFIAQASKNANKIKHMKSSPVVGGSRTNHPKSNLAIPSQHDRFQRSFEDLKINYAENVDEKKVGYFRGPGSKVHLKKNPNLSPTSPGVLQGESANPTLPVPDNGGLQNSIGRLPVVNENNNTDTASESKWTPGAPILRPESLAILEKQWEEEDRLAAEQEAQLQAESGQAGTSSTYQSYARVKEEYDMYNPPPREPTPTIDPPSLPPPPRPRRRPTAIVTETDSQEGESGTGASSSNKGKGKSQAQSPTSGYNSPLTPSEVTENIFGPQTFTRPGGEDVPLPTGILKVKPMNEDDLEEASDKKSTEDD